MNKKIILIFILITMFFISGCGKSEAEAFTGVEDVANKKQINMYFDWMDHQLSDDDSTQFYFTLTDTKTHEQAFISCGAVPHEGKLGIKISADGKFWRIGSLYYEPAEIEYSFLEVGDDEEIDQTIKDAANWSLTPLLDNYHIWLDDVVDYPNMETEREPIDVCYVTDSSSGSNYLITLTYVWDNRVNGF